jgi:hypothetical protein
MTSRHRVTLRSIQRGCYPLILWLLLGGSSGMGAQEPLGFSSLSIGLHPGSRNVFLIDANASVTFTLPAERRDLRLVFQDPRGMVWEITAPAAEAEQSSSQSVYEITIERPVPGLWSLSVLSTDPDPPGARLRIAYANRVHARLSIPRPTWVRGEVIPVSLELMDGLLRVKGLRTHVTVGDPANFPAVVVFRDDGSQGDRIARDGQYTAVIPADTPGTYHLEAQIEGTASTGPCHRTIALSFKVVPKAARLTGKFSQRILVGTPQ